MEDKSDEDGVFFAIVENMESQQLPRALDLKAKLDLGEALEDMDIDFLERVFADADELEPMLPRHPEYQDLVGQVVSLYHDITTRALANEQKPE